MKSKFHYLVSRMICLYFLFIFYLQHKNNFYLFYSFPLFLRIKIPQQIRGFCSLGIQGEYYGTIINLCDEIFCKRLGYKVFYENDMPLDEVYCDCILNVKKTDERSNNIFFYSDIIFDRVTILSFKKYKNKDENLKTAILSDSILAHFSLKKDQDSFLLVSSIIEALKLLENNDIKEFLVDPSYKKEVWNTIGYLSFEADDYCCSLFDISIEPIYFLFNYKIFWLSNFFSKILKYLKRERAHFFSRGKNIL